MKLTQVRAKEIMEQAQARAKHGPWVDQLDKVMTAKEKEEVTLQWESMPGNTSFYDAFMRFVKGLCKPLPNMKLWGTTTFMCNKFSVKDINNFDWDIMTTFSPKGNEEFRCTKLIHGAQRYVWWSPTDQCFYAQISPHDR